MRKNFLILFLLSSSLPNAHAVRAWGDPTLNKKLSGEFHSDQGLCRYQVEVLASDCKELNEQLKLKNGKIDSGLILSDFNEQIQEQKKECTERIKCQTLEQTIVSYSSDCRGSLNAVGRFFKRPAKVGEVFQIDHKCTSASQESSLQKPLSGEQKSVPATH